MSTDLTRWLASSPAERDRNRAIERIDLATDQAHARINAITDVTRHAVFGALTLEMTKREAELLCPDGSAAFNIITNAGVFNLASLVQRFDGRPS